MNFHENTFGGSLVVPSGETGRRTDMTKLTVAFRSFANAPKMNIISHKDNLSLNYKIL